MDLAELMKKEYRFTSIKEFNELLHIPAVGLEVATITREWIDNIGKDQLVEHVRQSEKYFNDLFTVPTMEDGKLRYWFELLDYGSNNWKIFYMLTWDRANLTDARRYEILPRDIIEKMAEGLVDPDRVITLNNIRSNLLKKNMDLQYVYISGSCIMGAVTEHSSIWTHWQGDIETAFNAYYNYKALYTAKVMLFTIRFLERLEAGKLPADRRIRSARDTSYRKMLVPRPIKREKAPTITAGEPAGATMRDEMWLDFDVTVLHRLAKVPEYNRWLWLKLEEIKAGPLKRSIDEYKAVKAFYRETMLRHRAGVDYTAKGKRPPYWFVLTLYGNNVWDVIELDPLPPAFESLDDLLPLDIREKMYKSNETPGCVITYTMDSPRPMGRRLEVQWVRYSPSCIMGKVFETEHDGMQTPGTLYYTPDFYRKMETHSIFFLLKRHMYRDPTVAEAFIDEFMTKIMPTLEKSPTPLK